MKANWMAWGLAGLLVLAPLTAMAQDKPVGETVGDAGRAVVEGSQEAYRKSKAFVVETGREIAADSKEAYQEAKDAGTRVTQDVKRGFRGQASTPAAGESGPGSPPN
jgi:hypothetical protein